MRICNWDSVCLKRLYFEKLYKTWYRGKNIRKIPCLNEEKESIKRTFTHGFHRSYVCISYLRRFLLNYFYNVYFLLTHPKICNYFNMNY